MVTLWHTVQSMPQEQLWVFGGILAEVLLQVIKRYLWKPDDEEKVKKILAALIVSCIIAAGVHGTGPSGFVAAWLGIFVGAIGYHEATDKLGAKQAWERAIRQLTGQKL